MDHLKEKTFIKYRQKQTKHAMWERKKCKHKFIQAKSNQNKIIYILKKSSTILFDLSTWFVAHNTSKKTYNFRKVMLATQLHITNFAIPPSNGLVIRKKLQKKKTLTKKPNP
jgi:hypothetical protein